MKMHIRLLPVLLIMLPMSAYADEHEADAKSTSPDAPMTATAPISEGATVECPALTRVKYPFLSCAMGAYGQIVLAGPAQEIVTSQMPPMDPFITNMDYWGN